LAGSRCRSTCTLGILLAFGAFRATAHNLYFLRSDGCATVVHLEGDVLDQEGPHFIAKTVRVKRALSRYTNKGVRSANRAIHEQRSQRESNRAGHGTHKVSLSHLEGQPGLDLLGERIGHNAVKVRQDLHGKLGIDPIRGDQFVQRVRQRRS